MEADERLKSLAAAHPDVAVESRRETARLHANDSENLKLWNEFVPYCLDALQSVYRRLDVTFDMSLGESFYQPQLAEVVDSLTQQASPGRATERFVPSSRKTRLPLSSAKPTARSPTRRPTWRLFATGPTYYTRT